MSEDRRMGDRKKGKSGLGTYMSAKKRQREYGMFRGIRSLIGIVLFLLLILFLMSGVVNQRKTGETLVNYFVHVGHRIGDLLTDTAEGDGPVKITQDGVYLKDAHVNEGDVLEGSPLDVGAEEYQEDGEDEDGETGEEDEEMEE